MMKHYFLLIASVLLSDVGCYGQQATTNAVTVERLHEQVRNLEQTVINLLAKIEEMKTTKSVSTDRVAQNMNKPRSLLQSLPVSPADGFTLGTRSTHVSEDPVAQNTELQNTPKRAFPSVLFNPADGLTLGDRSTNVGDEVGFTFSLTTSTQLIAGSKILFDHEVENIGNAYNPNSGEFVCPISGTYLFALNIVCDKGSYIEAAIEVYSISPRYILHTVCDQRERPSYDEYGLYCGETQNGGSAIVKLKQGDKVYVKMTRPAKVVGTVVGKKWSSFSGYLLRPL